MYRRQHHSPELPRTERRNMDQLLITVKEAADRLSLTPWSMYRLLDDKQVEDVYQGRRRYVVVSSLEEYVGNLREQRKSA